MFFVAADKLLNIVERCAFAQNRNVRNKSTIVNLCMDVLTKLHPKLDAPYIIGFEHNLKRKKISI